MKRGQIAVIGFIVTGIIIILIVSLFTTEFFSLMKSPHKYDEVKSDANHIGDVLLSEGHPKDWNSSNILKAGILSDNELSIRKLKEFSKLDYSRSKLLLGTKYDYMFFLESESGQKVTLPDISNDYFGWHGTVDYTGNGGYPFDYFFGKIQSKAKNMAKVEKFVNLEGDTTKNSRAKIVIYTWDEADIPANSTECNDHVNNDFLEDELIDMDDPGCTDPWDDDETDPPYEIRCRYTSGLCRINETALIEVSAGYFGLQRHAAHVGSLYSDRICCSYNKYLNVSIKNTCTADAGSEYIKLTSNYNAHLATDSEASYPQRTCLSFNTNINSNKKVNCRWGNSCTGDRKCVLSISSSPNGHIGGCPDENNIEIYNITTADNKLFCCKIN